MKRAARLSLWLGGAGTALFSAAAVASLVLIAPGVAVAGTPVGLATQGMAEQNIGKRLAHTHVRIGDAVLTGAELGASVDAHALARHAIDAHPLWNVTTWNPRPAPATVAIDPDVARPALRAAAPELFADPTNARVVFDTKTGKFAAVAGRPGRAVDLDDLAARVGDALAAGTPSVSITPKQTVAEPAATTEAAAAFAQRLNDAADTAGFYVGDERVEAVPLATIASWVSVTGDSRTGEFQLRPDEATIARAVTDLPGRVNREPHNELVVTNSKGERLRVLTEGRSGVHLAADATSSDDTAAAGRSTSPAAATIANAVAATLAKGELRFTLRGDLVPFHTTTIFRRIEVDKSTGTTSLFEGPTAGREKLVASYPVAIGTGGAHETRDGHFTVYAQLPSQDMGDCTGNHGFGYCTKNVPWVSYFDGDQGFHGTYWHNNFGAGARMSHGCVNMRIPDALALYRFAQVGTEVWVHD